jgi:hypothetical protein
MGAQPNKFEFILDVRGVETEVLTNAPDGWLNTAIKFTRSKTYMGVFRGESLPIKFVTKAARILRAEFYKYGILANVKQTVNLLNPNNWLYNTIYKGKLDFSTAEDELTSFTVNSVSDDFTVKLNANDNTDYAIPLDVDEAIYLELTPLELKEQATLIPSGPPDGNIHSDYFPPMALAANQQNSVNYSSQAVGYDQLSSPDWSTLNNNFFFSRVDGKLLIKGSIQGAAIAGISGAAHLKMYFINNSGTIRLSLFDQTVPTGVTEFNVEINQTLNVVTGEKLFFYVEQVGTLTIGTGIAISGGTFNLSYNTISPATMCRALPASYLFGKLLEAMNTNTNSSPNLPVTYKSDLLDGALSDLVITSSDSIRLATGSLYYPGDTLFPGLYKVLVGTATYNGRSYVVDETFSYATGVLSFSGSGAVVERYKSGFVGAVYDPGDTLQAGGKYLVGGDSGTTVTYNSITYSPGQVFEYKLGFDTFTGSHESSFVEQIEASAQLITNFRDFFQAIYSVQGGNASFGIETVPNPDPVDAILNPTVGRCFIENLDYVYRASVGNLNAGKVNDEIKIIPATDMLYNSIKVGYKDQQYSQLNGFTEVNSEQTYISNILNPKKELNLVSPYRADPFGIEEIRITQNDTAASRSDNDTIMVWKKSDPENTVPFIYYHPLRTEGLMTNTTTGKPMITGVDPSYYNWKLTPKRNLLRGGNYLASIFYNMQGYKLTLSAALKNTALVTTDIDGIRVAEADPVYISQLPKPLFLPFYALFKPGLPTNALQMIDNLPYGYIRFTYNQTEYKIFADTISVDVGENTQQEFKGLLTPNNDLIKLVH